MILLIDNYDSFTYNIFQYLAELTTPDNRIEVVRNDRITVAEIEKSSPQRIIISPGPCTPDEAGISLEVIKHFSGKIPLLGVCLGHQAIAQVFGGKVIVSGNPMHGKVSKIYHKNQGIFKDIPSPFAATRYHSLIVERSSLPADLLVTAETEDGTIMGLQHKNFPVFGVQFHPESIATEHGKTLLSRFLQGERSL